MQGSEGQQDGFGRLSHREAELEIVDETIFNSQFFYTFAACKQKEAAPIIIAASFFVERTFYF
jgi:hypothetical protein